MITPSKIKLEKSGPSSFKKEKVILSNDNFQESKNLDKKNISIDNFKSVIMMNSLFYFKRYR